MLHKQNVSFCPPHQYCISNLLEHEIRILPEWDHGVTSYLPCYSPGEWLHSAPGLCPTSSGFAPWPPASSPSHRDRHTALVTLPFFLCRVLCLKRLVVRVAASTPLGHQRLGNVRPGSQSLTK